MSSRTITLRLAGILGLAAVTLTGALITPGYAEDRDHRGGHDRGERHYGGYRGGGGYYVPPPVVYQPYGYYAQPGASINLNFPLRF